jgi:hypothetical protein
MPGLKVLIFVYNTNSSVLEALKDYTAGPAAAPEKDICTLCALTHSPVGMKKEWKRFLKNVGIPFRFLNRDEFLSEFGNNRTAFPCVLVQEGKDLKLLTGIEELNRCRDLTDLILLMEQHLAPDKGSGHV